MNKEIEDLLNASYDEPGGKQKLHLQLNKTLYRYKFVRKKMGTNDKLMIPIEILEIFVNGLYIHYGYSDQGILRHYKNEKFVFYYAAIIKHDDTKHWIGNVYGKTLWEFLAKTIIKISEDIRSENG